MARKNDSLASLLLVAPWWVSAGLGVVVVAALKWMLPIYLAKNQVLSGFAHVGDGIVPFAGLFFGLLAIGSAIFARKRRRLVDEQTSLESLRQTSWKDFEFLVAETYKRRGYAVEFNTGGGADGGVDLELRKDGQTTFVQCKQWKVFKVGAPTVRELLGAITAARANAGIVITTGAFTRDAVAFAAHNAIELIDGPRLLNLVSSVQARPSAPTDVIPAPPARVAAATTVDAAAVLCPLCHAPMVKRTAKRGARAGQQFWGCSTYPNCRGSRPV